MSAAEAIAEAVVALGAFALFAFVFWLIWRD